MKIGIITFWQTQDNYGQILQCWALQHYLISIGHDAYLIRYTHANPKPLVQERIIKLLKVYPVFRKLYTFFVKGNKQNASVFHQRSFDKFKNQYIRQSSIIYRNLLELQKNPPQADCYIVGSDQVWAQLLNKKNNEVYFLNFGDKSVKRISYAASFAMQNYPANLLSKLSRQLARFNSISVREKSGVDICRLAGRKSKWVIDPTLLLKAKEYLQFVRKGERAPYIFFYILNIKTPEDISFSYLKHFFSNYNLVATTASGFNQISFELEGCTQVYPTIEEWLSLIYYSELVVTTSFHGVALSIRLNKPFIFFPLSDTYTASNNRVYDLLESLGLSSRIIRNIKDLETVVTSAINWNEVNDKLNRFIASSQEYLNFNL